MRDDETKQVSFEPVFPGESKHSPQHHPVQPHDVDRPQAEQKSRAVRAYAHSDVVRQNLKRQDRRRDDVQHALGPQLALLYGGDELGRGEERNEPREQADQAVAGGDRQDEDRRCPGDMAAELVDGVWNLVAEQAKEPWTELPSRCVKRRMGESVLGLKAAARVRCVGLRYSTR